MSDTKSKDVTTVPSTDLVDEYAVVMASIAEFESRKKILSAEIIKRAGNKSRMEGTLWGVTIVAESVTTGYDTKKMLEELGERLMRKFLKVSNRAAYLLVTRRKADEAA